ncbi:MAG: molybdopterin cofactor-binding domain-containing protein, partial [Gemmatimonadaceae bacterium]
MLLGIAASRFGVDRKALVADKGTIRANDGRAATYGALVANQSLHVPAEAHSKLAEPQARRIVGGSMPRVDIPAKVTGGVAYVQDLRLPNMVHARVVRPPGYGARLLTLDTGAIAGMPGVIKVVRNGSFLAVAAEGEFQAIAAMRAADRAAVWETPQGKAQTDVYEQLLAAPHEDFVIHGDATPIARPWSREASYRRPYQMHGSIGPSCAVALYDDGDLTVWTHSQGVYPLRRAIAEMLSMPPERIRCIHMEGSGCYGHNAADDAGADAALIATSLPGRPVRVQWMREQEHTWEPCGSAMVTTAQ